MAFQAMIDFAFLPLEAAPENSIFTI